MRELVDTSTLTMEPRIRMFVPWGDRIMLIGFAKGKRIEGRRHFANIQLDNTSSQKYHSTMIRPRMDGASTISASFMISRTG